MEMGHVGIMLKVSTQVPVPVCANKLLTTGMACVCGLAMQYAV